MLRKIVCTLLACWSLALSAAPINVLITGQNIRSASPFLKNFEEACRREGIEVYFYLQPPALDYRRFSLDFLKQFQVVAFHGNPDAMASCGGTAEDAARFRELLEQFRQAGGGLLWTPTLMMPHTDSWNRQVGAKYGMKMIEEAIRDADHFVDLRPEMQKPIYHYVHTTNITEHPVTAGVRGLLLPRIGEWSWPGTVPMEFSPEWTVLLRAMPSAHTVANAGRAAAKPDFRDDLPGSVASAPALVAIRDGENGAGNMAVFPFYSAHTFQNFGGPAYDDAMMLNGHGELKSDGFRLFVNLVRYLAGPAAKAGLGGFQRPESVRAQLNRSPIDWSRLRPLSDDTLTGGNREQRRFRGVIGLNSHHAGGKSTVPEYAAAARKLGLDYVIFLDDAARSGEEAYQALQRECEQATDDHLLVLPGLRLRDHYGYDFFLIAPRHFPNPELMSAPGVVKNYWGMVMKLEGGGLGLWNLDRAPADPFWVMWPFLVMSDFYRDGRHQESDWEPYVALQRETHTYLPLSGTFAESATELEQALTAGTARVNVIAAVDRAQLLKLLTRRDMPLTYPVYATNGPELLHWSVRGAQGDVFRPGGDRSRIELKARSDEPITEVTVLDAVTGQLLRRYLPPPDTREFQVAFDLSLTNRRVLIPRVTDRRGRVAVGSLQRVETEANRLYPMTDRLMGMLHSTTFDPETGTRRQRGGWLGSPNWTKRRNSAGTYPLPGDQDQLRIFGFDGGRIFSGAVDINPHTVLPDRTEQKYPGYRARHRFAAEHFVCIDYNGEYEFGAPFNNEWILSDLPKQPEFTRTDNRVWCINPRWESPIAFNLQHQTLRFKRPTELKEHRLLYLRRWFRSDGPYWFIRDQDGTVARKLALGEKFSRTGVLPRGGYLYEANEIGGPVGLINLGPQELSYRADERGAWVFLPGGSYPAGAELTARYLIFGRDRAPEMQNQDEWLKRYIHDLGIDRPDLAPDEPFWPHAVAENGGAELQVPALELPHDLPLTVKVTPANAIYGCYSSRDRTLMLVEPFEDLLHSAQDTRPGEDRIYLGELITADNPALRLDAVVDGPDRLLLELHNPTDQPQRTGLVARKFFTIPEELPEIPAGSSRILTLSAPEGSFRPYCRPVPTAQEESTL